ncbi:peptidoglycan-binding domain-containing protein [Streptomyces sp. H10-C2]|uniref:peptidoglycan-binding domain-containing protein n=1 Tax=unclassified Streptomyces TaxID=2593676 RepID=UPI0024BA11AF|nr:MULTISPECIES: peptidoglycan-binding domain-containing protein [unclassified Streptomyces]MDJ0342672.1 peptidoglycan-binding domain-containing protein [Streptomyces sp. PH10-H1]MDJ0372619.1 peptidoglycan-binding domain-containing protein [Streptomyces sp. H10-C2]
MRFVRPARTIAVLSLTALAATAAVTAPAQATTSRSACFQSAGTRTSPNGGWTIPAVYLRLGSSGICVRELQEDLASFGVTLDEWNNGTFIDGRFGPRTDHALRRIQSDLHLDADGVVGPLTWQALVSGTSMDG